jgi:hypothetical protein
LRIADAEEHGDAAREELQPHLTAEAAIRTGDEHDSRFAHDGRPMRTALHSPAPSASDVQTPQLITTACASGHSWSRAHLAC